MTEQPSTCPHSDQWEAFRPLEHEGMNEFFAVKRAESPVFLDAATGYWIVTRREDVRAVLFNPRTFSAANVHNPFKPFPPEVVQFLTDGGFRRDKTQANCDAPRHGRIRKASQSFLNIRQFKARTDEVQALIQAAVQDLRGRGRVDLMRDFAYQLPVRVLFLLLGVSDINASRIKAWADSRFMMISGGGTDEEIMQAAHETLDLWNFCGALIQERQAKPGEDYPSHLLAIHADDPEAITLNEIQNLTFGVLLAGHETTTNAIGNTVYHLLSQRDQWEQLVTNPDLIPNATKEGLRAGPPVINWRRVATQDTLVGGVEIPEGAELMLSLASANRDELHFDNAESFDVSRENAKDHNSFGYGAHFCLGAALARMEITMVLKELTVAFPKLALVPDTDPEWQPTLLVRGPGKLLVDLNEDYS